MTDICDLDTPAALLDKGRLEANIARAKAQCERLGVVWRPHLKTHKSLAVARMQIASPTGPATVSTLKEAEYFAAAGITDLIYAVGIVPSKLPRVHALNSRGADVKVILDSVEAARAVSDWCRAHAARLRVLIEIDCDEHRSGLTPDDPAILETARALESGAELVGVLTHAGGSYGLSEASDRERAAQNEVAAVVRTAQQLREAGFDIRIVSIGSTPTLMACRDATGVTEIRSGVGSVGDLFMANLGVCRLDDIALSVLVSVIGRQSTKGWLITDGGWMAMSRDRGTAKQKTDWGYGAVCDEEGRLLPEYWVRDANQEHGIIARRDGGAIDPTEFPLGRKLRILPNHACPTGAAFDRYALVDAQGSVLEMIDRINNW
ncbi:MAG: alanine racemase [Duodenibacillus sp.]|nr:alanine racemase [Duodenibacillus sp.]